MKAETNNFSHNLMTVDLTEEEVQKLGYKSEADEIEKFVLANCQELAKEKWLCPLSGKKFKAPEFVRKHIFNKFKDDVDQVRRTKYLIGRATLPYFYASSRRLEVVQSKC